jgi:hypothetical protein
MTEQLSVTLEADGHTVTVTWDLARIRSRESGGQTPVWQADGEPGPGTILRVLSATFDDGRVLALAGLRPIEAEHDAERLGTLLVEPDGGTTEAEETLISTEYDEQGLPRRLGLEIYRAGDALPARIAADREALGDAVDGRSVIALRLSVGGVAGRGLLETVTR